MEGNAAPNVGDPVRCLIPLVTSWPILLPMNPEILARKHAEGLTYAEYVCTGSDSQQENWKTLYDQAVLTDPQQRLLATFTRRINVIALSGIWCGDCVQQGPLIARIAEAAPTCISLRWLDRDAHMDLQESVSINAGHRVPVLIFCAEDFELVGWHGDRTLNRYRALARKQLGASCPLPGGPVDRDELAATVGDWIEQFERVHLLLRLSSRLRQIHRD